jgi:hypothetical protein
MNIQKDLFRSCRASFNELIPVLPVFYDGFVTHDQSFVHPYFTFLRDLCDHNPFVLPENNNARHFPDKIKKLHQPRNPDHSLVIADVNNTVLVVDRDKSRKRPYFIGNSARYWENES